MTSVLIMQSYLIKNNAIVHSPRNVILNIVSLVLYWTGNLSSEVQATVQNWLPTDMEVIPLQAVRPEDMQIIDWVVADDD